MSEHKRSRGGQGPRAIAGEVERLTRPALGKRGFAEAAIIAEWPTVVGAVLGANTCPLKIVFPRGQRGDGVLHLRVANGAFATELQHLEPQLLERVNAHFGYRAVARVALTQGPLPRRAKPKPPPPAPADPAAVERAVAAVGDPEVKQALARLGAFVLRRRP
jgi:hypothetical protein